MALGVPKRVIQGGCQKDRAKQFTAALAGIRRHFFTTGTIKQWIRLPRQIVQLSSLNVFKT